jgi:hypothetical protein
VSRISPGLSLMVGDPEGNRFVQERVSTIIPSPTVNFWLQKDALQATFDDLSDNQNLRIGTLNEAKC